MKEKKYCSGCKKTLSVENFGIHNGRKDGLQVRCKKCRKEYDKQRYQKDKGKRQQELNKNYRKKIKKLLEDYKRTIECSNCGENRWYVLDFHHLDSDNKKQAIGQMVSDGFGFDKIKKEIEKCIPLCRNCHAELHYFEKEEHCGMV